jgi:hypothetical protein
MPDAGTSATCGHPEQSEGSAAAAVLRETTVVAEDDEEILHFVQDDDLLGNTPDRGFPLVASSIDA